MGRHTNNNGDYFPIGGVIAEQKTNSDAVSGTVTFDEHVYAIEIYNSDTTNDGVFTVNGIAITVPKETSYARAISGTPGKTVSVTGSTSYEIRRLE